MLHYYRCLDCLSVFTTQDKLTSPQCGICEGKVEHMGEVNGGKLYKYKYVTPCDGRCTHASGPDCDCSCGGANHGSGKIVKVAMINDNNIPVLQAENGTKALAIAEEYRNMLNQAIAAIENLPHYEDFKRRNYIADKDAWLKIRNALEKLYDAKKYKTHSRRIKKLTEIINL